MRYLLVVALLVPQLVAADLNLVRDGRSEFVVYRAPDAPPSVHRAAEEIQRIVAASTGVTLPIVDEPKAPMIALGDSPAARAAGVRVDGLPDDAFRIAVRDGNVFIVGKDLPNDAPPLRGYFSFGTLYGAEEFLERVVGVRWLLPGPVGEDIPRQDELTVAELDLVESPDLPIRMLRDVQDRHPAESPAPLDGQEWLQRQKIVSVAKGRKLEHGHSWNDFITEETLAEHPDWRAVYDGKPYVPQRHSAVKYCTTNPELIDAFAAGVMKRIETRPDWPVVSISPSDGGVFCQCERCAKLVEEDPHGRVSQTPLILTFYNAVAEKVAAKYPDTKICGYVYYNYLYPPNDPIPMHPNIWLAWAPLNYYGRGLQKPVYHDEFPDVAKRWLEVTPNFVYHNYSEWMRAFNGAPLPPALDILKLELPTLKAVGAKGVDMIGLGAWGYGGPTNYILAKQMWDTSTDVDGTFREWLQRAYGPGWEPMHRLYMMLEDRMRDWKEKESPVYRGQMYEVNYEVIDAVHRPVFGQMEQLYLEALGKVETDAQRQRLEMFGDNLIQLHHGMRHAGMLENPEESTFYRSDEDYAAFLTDREFKRSLYRDHGKWYTGPIWKGEWSG